MVDTKASSINSETNEQVQNIVDFIAKTWPDIDFSGPGETAEQRINRFSAQVNNGERTIESLRDDIFTHIVGDEKVGEWVNSMFEERGIALPTDERRLRIIDELTSGSRQFNTFGADLDPFSTITDQGGGVTTNDDGPNEDIAEDKVGGASDTTTSILTSRDMGWFFDKGTGSWYVSYKLPGSERRVFFEASGKQLDAIFGEGQRPDSFTTATLQELTEKDGWTFSGNIAEVAGEGSFEGEVERVIALALDEGILPDWASDDPAVMDILYIASAEGKPDDWVIEQLSGLASFKARFPGIDAMTNLGLTVAEAVTGFLEFEQGLKNLAVRSGKDPSTVTPQQVGDLLANGHSLEDAQFVYSIFDTMDKNAGALSAFNEVLAARGLDPLDEEGMYEFMAGNAPKEMYDIWEESSLNRAAQDAGLNLSVDDAIELAKRTEGLTSYGTAYEGLTVAAQNLLKFRSEIGLDQYGINQDDLVDLSLGLPPGSGASQADLARNMERAIGAASAKRGRARVNPFKRFTGDGVPQAASLTGTRSEG